MAGSHLPKCQGSLPVCYSKALCGWGLGMPGALIAKLLPDSCLGVYWRPCHGILDIHVFLSHLFLQLGIHGYAFAITNNGYILTHPELRPLVRILFIDLFYLAVCVAFVFFPSVNSLH